MNGSRGPIAEKLAQACANDDADDKVAIVRHCDEHDKVRQSKGTGVKGCSNQLLDRAGSEGESGKRGGALVELLAVSSGMSGPLSVYEPIILFTQSMHAFETDD
jgi:hypothetical protein